MFALGVRLWTGEDMIYPSRFSILIDFETKISSMRTYVNNNRIDSKTYMMLTPGIAINGEIYELDIICSRENEDLVGIVEFDPSLGAFVAKIKGENVYIANDMSNYEIIGNIFEDFDEFKYLLSDVAKFEKIIEDTLVQNEENKRQAELKAKKEQEKKQRELEKNSIEEDKAEDTINETNFEEEQKKEELPVIEENNETVPDIEEIEIPEIPEDLITDEFQPEEIADFNMFSDNAPIMEEIEEPTFDFDDDIQTDIKLYVDGQGGKTESEGSFSYILQCGDYERVDNGYSKNTTKQRMELQAVITALDALTTKCNVKIYTTSQYLIVPFVKGWITRWKANNWKKEDQHEVKNKDLWEKLYDLYSMQNIEWEFIKPGSSIVEILRCIDLSKEALSKKDKEVVV